jgi:uncharacterized membrane protein YccC
MGKNRLEAFSDGVIAIIITIMVLELKVPHGPDLQALVPLIPTLLGYLLSFVYVGIYWNKLQYANHPPHCDKLLRLAVRTPLSPLLSGSMPRWQVTMGATNG